MNHRKKKYIFSGIIHVVGVITLFTLFALFFISQTTGALVVQLLGDTQVASEIAFPLIVLFGLSILTWALGFFVFTTLGKSRAKTLTRTRGTIMTETLIVLPVFLLLTSGLAQMGINSMAGLLTTVGAYEAGRTLAVWGPEIGRNRISGVSQAVVVDKARLAVAVIVAPVARTGYRDLIRCSGTPEFKKYMKGMEAAGLLPTEGAGGRLKFKNYTESFGDKSFAQRGPDKLKSAYCSVAVDTSVFNDIPTTGTSGGDFTIKVAYIHQPVFPFVKKIFGNTRIEREYTMRSHIPPNQCLPENPNFFSLGGC